MDVSRFPIDVDTRAPTGRTNAYLVGTDEPVLVDPAGLTEDLDAAAERRGVEHVAVTHAHGDHVGAVAAYADRFDATVHAHAEHAARFERATGVEPDRTFYEGGAVGPTTVLETPGHAPDHVAFVVGDPADGGDPIDGGVALTGDLAFAEGSVLVGGSDGDMRAYLASLRRLYVRDFGTLHPGHGPTITDPAATLERLLRHRLDREERVLDAIRSGTRTVDGIVEAAYDRDLSGIRDMARRSVEAHLEKLVAEDVLERDGDDVIPR